MVGVSNLAQDSAGRLAVPYVDADAFYCAPSDPPVRVRAAATERDRRSLQALHGADG